MPKKTADTLAKLREQRDQLNARIQQEQAKQKQHVRKKRDRSLVMWGVVVEAMLKDGTLAPDKWAALCQRHLPAERNRDAALWLLQQLQVDDAIIQESTPTSAAIPPSPETKPPSENLKSDHPATNDTGASNTASSPPLNSAG